MCRTWAWTPSVLIFDLSAFQLVDGSSRVSSRSTYLAMMSTSNPGCAHRGPPKGRQLERRGIRKISNESCPTAETVRDNAVYGDRALLDHISESAIGSAIRTTSQFCAGPRAMTWPVPST